VRLVSASAVLVLALCSARADAHDPASEPRAASELRERFRAAGVPEVPLELALRAFACGDARGEFSQPILTLIDYSRPSTVPRLWVLDLAGGVVRFRTLVAHGRGSGLARAVAFSNLPGSKQSSLGLFRTGETYDGTHGYSLRLEGLEAGVNNLAYPRNIVIHGADYATPAFASRHGRLGRSWGCPALDPAVHRDVIDAIRDHTALFAYYPDARWLASSPYLQCGAPHGTVVGSR
jgi:L,D-transpeptidase catalytic domain